MKGYKTIAFNSLVAIIAIVHALNPTAELPGQDAVQSVVDNFDTFLTIFATVGNGVLRAVTTTAIFKKE